MILVLFASKSDEETYTRIATGLKKHGIEYELRIASAHKTPDKAEEIIKKNYSLIISGAGLAAALPGVIAARKMTPVIGVPCPGAYDGLDSFLSIVQMPPGIPVLACQKEEAAYETGKILERKTKVAMIGEGKTADKAMKTLDELGIQYEMGDYAKDAINIAIINLGETPKKREELIIYCPEGEAKAEDAIKAMKSAKYGLWVGLNRGENAAVAAAEILGKTKELAEYRKKMAQKINDADAEVRK